MKHSDGTRPAASKPMLLPVKFALACLVAGVLSASAQSVVSSVPAPSAPPASLQPLAGDEGLTNQAIAPLQWGPIAGRPHLVYRLSRGDGIQPRPGQSTETTISTLSAGLLMEIGQRWTADYTPTWTVYSNDAFTNTLEHALRINGRASFTDGSLTLGQSYNLSDTPRIETGRQTREESVSTSLGVIYSLSRKTRINGSVSRSMRYLENAPNSEEWSVQSFYHYQFTSRLDVGVGVAWGYTKVDPGIDMSSLSPSVRIGWRPTPKLSFSANASAEQRQFKQAGSKDLNSVPYGVSAFYQPFQYTTLSVSGNRGVSVSYFAGQVTENTGWTVGLNQRLLQRLNLNVSSSRSQSEYITAGGPTNAILREDSSDSFNIRLSTGFLRRGTVGVFYQYTRNDSDVDVYNFSSKQVGVEISYSY